jgi:drug/metabolite transporter (DMT)-like permease
MSQHYSRQVCVGAAFLAIYILWGSTYLAVALGLESIPPFLLMGLRSLCGGLVLLAWSGRKTGVRSGQAWLHAGACGLFFFVGCHGVLAYAQVRVPSGIAAIMLATIPFWITLINFVFPTASRPLTKTIVALLPGFGGVALIAWWQATSHEHPVGVVGILLLLISALSWAVGSFLSRRHSVRTSAIALSGMQLTVGGSALLIVSIVTGELQGFSPREVSAESALALAYLIIAGTIVGFAAYVWLLDNNSTSLVATYTFVNPVIAVALGWVVLQERLTATMLFGALLVVGSVVAVWLLEPSSTPKLKES